MHDDVAKVEYDPEIVLQTLHTGHFAPEFLLHLDKHVIGYGRNVCGGVCVADDEKISNRRLYGPEVERNDSLALLLQHRVCDSLNR